MPLSPPYSIAPAYPLSVATAVVSEAITPELFTRLLTLVMADALSPVTNMAVPPSNPTVFAQGSLIVRQMDPTVIHPIEVSVNPLVCAPHIGVVMKGCITVLVTGMPVARIGDPVDFGNLTTGAMTVHAGVG